MDAIGTAVGIASFGIQVCQGLLRYYDAWKGYDSDLSSTYDAITDLSKTLTLLKDTLQLEGDKERVERVRTCVDSCESALHGLEDKRHSLQNYAQPEGLRQKMRSGLQRAWYPFKKETLLALKVSVVSVQDRLKLALDVLQLEVGTESRELVHRVMRQISEQDDAMAQIVAQSQRILDLQQSDQFRKIVAWIAPPDPETNHASASRLHENNTGGWLLKSPQYQSWKAGAVSHLWMYGKAGCGKTILVSTAIEDIRSDCEQDPDISYAFFYFSFSDEHKQSDGDLLRSLVAQLGWREPSLSMLRQAYENPRQSVPGPDGLEKILLASIRSCSRVYLLVDALDECLEDNGARQNVLERIEKLTQQASNLSVFATSREVDKIRKAMEELGPEPLRVIAPVVDADIRVWMATQMSRDPQLRNLSPELQTLIESTIASKANGMFRWAYCQLRELKNLDSFKPKYVKQALKALPKDLDITYSRMLVRIKEMYHQEALTLLYWLAYARSPPTLSELVDAAITDPIEESNVQTDERGGLQDALNILSGLVTVEENRVADGQGRRETEHNTHNASIASHDQGDALARNLRMTPHTRVRLAHFSVKEYLESKRILKSEACRFHLQSAAGHRFLAQSCLTYLRYYSACREKPSTKRDLTTFPLLRYAAESWFHHSAVQQSREIDREVSFLQSDRARNDWIAVFNPERPWNPPFVRERAASPPLYYASLLGLCEIAKQLLDNDADVNAQGGEYGNALQVASREGHKDVVQLLLDEGADVNAQGGFHGNALQAASFGGHKDVMQLLLDKGADADAQGGEYGNALQAASRRGDKEVVQLLLDKGADANAQGGYHSNALQAASGGGYKEVVQLLLDKGADANAQGAYYSNALQAASEGGYKEVVQLLLDEGADVDAQGGHYGSALLAAIKLGHKDVVQLLQAAAAQNPTVDENS